MLRKSGSLSKYRLTQSILFFVFTASCIAQTRSKVMEDAGKSNLPARKIGANGLIAVSVYDAPELTRTIRVDSDGSISLFPSQALPSRGQRPTPPRTRNRHRRRAREGRILVEPVVKVRWSNITAARSASPAPSASPSRSRPKREVTLLEALARAEG